MQRIKGAEGRRQPTLTAGDTQQGDRIVPSTLRIGNCHLCGEHIRLTGAYTTCGQCAAWRRWYSAHRIASQALREVGR